MLKPFFLNVVEELKLPNTYFLLIFIGVFIGVNYTVDFEHKYLDIYNNSLQGIIRYSFFNAFVILISIGIICWKDCVQQVMRFKEFWVGFLLIILLLALYVTRKIIEG